MKTEVFMIRNLDGIEVRQSNQTEMFNVTDLVKGYNEMRRARGLETKRLDNYWRLDSTQEFLQALEKQTLESEGLLKTTKKRQVKQRNLGTPRNLCGYCDVVKS